MKALDFEAKEIAIWRRIWVQKKTKKQKIGFSRLDFDADEDNDDEKDDDDDDDDADHDIFSNIDN